MRERPYIHVHGEWEGKVRLLLVRLPKQIKVWKCLNGDFRNRAEEKEQFILLEREKNPALFAIYIYIEREREREREREEFRNTNSDGPTTTTFSII